MEPEVRELFQRMGKVEQDVVRVDEAQDGHEILCAERYRNIIKEQKSQVTILGKLYSRIWAVVVGVIGGLLVISGSLIAYIINLLHTGA